MSSSHSTPASFRAARCITPQISVLSSSLHTCSTCIVFAGSALNTVRPASFCIDISRISDSNPTLIAAIPCCSSLRHNSSAIPQPSSVTTTVPDKSSDSALPIHSSISTCQRRHPFASDVSDELTSGITGASGIGASTCAETVDSGTTGWFLSLSGASPPPLIFMMYAVK